jgi:hypothetical protein
VVAGFEHEADARRFLEAMRARFEEFALSLHPDKTRLIEFGRHAATRRAQRGLGKPETFNFLGFTFICGKSRQGRFLLRRDRMRIKLQEIKGELRRRMHQPIPEQGKWLRQVVTGFFAYHAVPTNFGHSGPSGFTRSASGDARCGGAVRRIASRGSASSSWPPTFSRPRASSILGPAIASSSNTQGGGRMQESCTYGSVRGAPSNGRPYRDPRSGIAILAQAWDITAVRITDACRRWM